MESVIRMCLDAMALQLLEKQAGEPVLQGDHYCVMQCQCGLLVNWAGTSYKEWKILSCSNTCIGLSDVHYTGNVG